jgi:hypothetical protein
MPLARYFLYVGGVLFALLFVAGAFLPKSPRPASADSHLLRIQISSDQRWPERVVFDTGVRVEIPAQRAELPAERPSPAEPADASAKALGALAQLQPQPPSASEPRPADRKKRMPKPQHQFNPAKRSTAPAIRLARHPQFGWFGYSIW